MSRIVELELRLAPAVEGSHRVQAVLRERAAHPPHFRAARGVVEEEQWSRGVDAEGTLSVELLDVESAFRFLVRRLPSEEPFLQLMGRRAALSLFPGDVLGLVRRFLEDAREERSSLYRFTVRSEVRAALEYPWMALLWSLAPSFHPMGDEDIRGRIAFLARYPETSGSKVSFQVPLRLGIDGGQETLSLDGFEEEARRLGVFDIQDARISGQDCVVLHLVDRTGWSPPPRDFFEPLWPRLLVLQRNTDSGSPPVDEVLSEYLERGAGAVLRVSGPEKECRLFFQRFYREVFCNKPLEQCVREVFIALPALPVEVAFGACEGGEYTLSFTRAVAAARAQSTARLPIGGPATEPGAIEALESFDPREPRRGVHPLDPRIHRYVRTAQLSLETELHARREQIDTRVRTLDDTVFDAEPRRLSQAVQFVQQVIADAEEVYWQRLRRVNLRELSMLLERQDDQTLRDGFIRLLNVWLSQGSEGVPIKRDRPLSRKSKTWLHVKISPARIAEAFAEAFPDIQFELAFRDEERVRLDVCVFHDARFIEVDQPRGELLLPLRGESTEFRTRVRLGDSEQCRLRVCVFYKDTLLQSLVVEADVVADKATASRVARAKKDARPIRYALDYVANPDFLLLERPAHPTLTLVTNHAPNGDLWLGVFSTQGEGRGGLRSESLHTFSSAQLADYTQRVRAAYETLQGHPPAYFYRTALDTTNQADRARQLVAVAVHGARLYNGLFQGNQTILKENLRALHEGLATPGLISIARCNPEEQSIPWAMVYGLMLDTGNEERLKPCPVFLAQLEAGEDLLDAPDSCRALAGCPLRGLERRYTVCPFGFWGVHHRIEQPAAKHVRVEGLDKVPRALTSPTFTASCQLVASPEPPRALMGYGSQIPSPEDHYQELSGLAGWRLDKSGARDEVITALEREPHILYLYCHGIQDRGVFKLQFPEAPIEATSLQLDWTRERPPFFVFLNACDSVATLPETLNHFLGTLINMGALAVIGSEIRINSAFARQFAQRVLADFLAGHKIGEAFLRARRHFLRQLNPLGLAYTLHAAADVHLHGSACSHCPS